ncbi:MAG: hypothetical protein K0Q59_2455 [Paenibacillus sp.]|nr:hypothetical protein [Paenibacillus sp.]
MNNNKWLITAIAGLTLASTACSSDGGEKAVNSENGGSAAKKVDMSKPIELVYYSDEGTTVPGSDAEFMTEFGQYMQKKYPNVTFKNNIYYTQTKTKIEDYVAAGTRYDLHKGSFALSYKYVDLKLVSDISDLIAKYKVDLSGVNPVLLNQYKGAAGGKLIGLPYQALHLVLFYNKSIFDKFGVSYPKEGMTWQDMTEMSRKVTRLDGGLQYTGFGLQQSMGIVFRNSQLSLEQFDPKTNKSTYGDPRWKQLFDTFSALFQIPGNPANATSTAVGINAFIKEQTQATLLAYSNHYSTFPDTLNWDIAAAPSLSEKPGLGFQPIPSIMSINANSPFREEAFLMMVAMISKEVQLDRAKNVAASSVLTDPEMRRSIGANIPSLKGKNTAAMMPVNVAPAIAMTPYTSEITTELNTAFENVAKKTKDANTALREAEEKSNQKIAERMAATQTK